MRTGAYISGAVHVLFIGFLLFGGLFSRNRLPEVTVADVTVLSNAEFEAMSADAVAPQLADVPKPPDAPVAEDAPQLAARIDNRPTIPAPAESPDASQIDAPAEPLPTPEPSPDASVTDQLTVPDAPPVLDDRPEAPLEATPAPAPRVAPEPAAPPPPDVEAGPQIVEQTAPAPSPEPPQPVKEATAPEEATTEIVTEAEVSSLAPAGAPRPKSRPDRPRASAQDTASPQRDAIADAVAAAVAESATAPQTAPAASGPPLTRGEQDALRVAVQRCWNVGSLSSEALRSTVTVAVSMAQDGRPDTGSIRMLGYEGGSDAGARQAFEAARRAIIRCGARGYDLPVDKYAQWRNIEMTFNPEGMRLK